MLIRPGAIGCFRQGRRAATGSAPAPGPALNAETTALLNAAANPQSSARIAAIDNLITAGKDHGWWARMSWFWALRADDTDVALIDWKNPTGTRLLAVNGPGFTPNLGFQTGTVGASTTAHLTLQRPPSALTSAAVPASQHNIHFGLDVAVSGGSANPALGANSGTRIVLLTPRTSTSFQGRVCNTASVTVGTVPTRLGHSVVSRSNSAGFTGYRDGVKIATVAATSSVITGQSQNIILGQDSGTYVSDTFSLVHFGQGLSDDEAADFADDWAAYKAAA